jgi:hypothetical protein
MKGDAAMSTSSRFTSERISSFSKAITFGILFLIFISFSAGNVFSAEVLLTWEPNSESDLAGYKIHYGTAGGEYTNVVDVGNVTDCTIGSLEEGLTYYFAATAYDSFGNESAYNEEISLYIESEETLDTDEDGMADIWEMENFGSLDCDGTDDFDSDNISDLDEFLEGTDPLVSDLADDGENNADKDVPLLEIGEVEVNENWTRVTFNQAFLDPVVVAKVQACNGDSTTVTRIRNVDTEGFEIRLQRSDDQGKVTFSESVGYLVIEGGSYALGDGTFLEAERFEMDTKNSSFGRVHFNQKFQKAPVILTSVTTLNETDTTGTSQIRNIDTDGFEFAIKKQKRNNNNQNHATEIISYIAWEPSSGVLGSIGFEVNDTGGIVNDEFHSGQNSLSILCVLTDMQAANNDDPAMLCLGPAVDSIDMTIEEEQFVDREGVGYMLFETVQ